MTAATSAHGTLLKVGDNAAPETFTTIAEVKNISGPGIKLDTKEVTSQDSTDHWRERIATLLDCGAISFGINYMPQNATHSNAAGLVYLITNRLKRNFKLVMTDPINTEWIIPAYVTAFDPEFNTEDETQAQVTLTPAGKPTLA